MLFGHAFRITRQRGEWRYIGPRARGLATWHPSAVLRMPYEERRHEAYVELVADLRELALALTALAQQTGTKR